MFGRNHLVLEFCLWGFFKLLIQFHYWQFACSYFLFLSDSVFGDYTFLGICPFLLGCPLYWQVIIHSNLLMIPCISVVSIVNIFSIISDFIYLRLALFILVSAAKVLSILFIFSRNELLILLIFFDCPFSLYFIYFHSGLYYFLPSTDFGLHLFFFFLVPWGIKLGCLFELFIVLWCRHLSLWISLLQLLLL